MMRFQCVPCSRELSMSFSLWSLSCSCTSISWKLASHAWSGVSFFTLVLDPLFGAATMPCFEVPGESSCVRSTTNSGSSSFFTFFAPFPFFCGVAAASEAALAPFLNMEIGVRLASSISSLYTFVIVGVISPSYFFLILSVSMAFSFVSFCFFSLFSSLSVFTASGPQKYRWCTYNVLGSSILPQYSHLTLSVSTTLRYSISTTG
mmetsp:Transcript_6660/g.23978  ORF Transcript_6660/g.23978 Transcript_6660/m.23978 type:complete len:205 (-) Transcript_6660:1140-1754(-)